MKSPSLNSSFSLYSATDKFRGFASANESTRGLRYIRLREVCARVGLKQSTVYRLIELGRFPKQIKLSERASAWIESEIEDFMMARIAERDHESSAPESPYMRMGDVMRRTGLSSSKIYELVRKGKFPKWLDRPKIASAWGKSDVEAWLVSNPTLINRNLP